MFTEETSQDSASYSFCPEMLTKALSEQMHSSPVKSPSPVPEDSTQQSDRGVKRLFQRPKRGGVRTLLSE